MRHPFLIFLILFANATVAQNYQIGTAALTLTDTERDRQIEVAVYYPATSSGANAPVATSITGFPVVSFGHGFVIATESYSWLWEALVPEGYILIFPKTEGQLLPAPNHQAFGADILFCAREVVRQGTLPGSPLFGKVAPRIALMGHSMGGGATYLGASGMDDVQTTITFAAAETNPSAINAALSVNVPSLVIAAKEDCVTPAASNQVPVYNNLPGEPKAIVNVTGASHCNFTNGSASACYLGEVFTCFGFGPFISRQAQHQRTLEVLTPWLDTFLRKNCVAAESISTVLNSGEANNFWTYSVEGLAELACPVICEIPDGFIIEGSFQTGVSLSWNDVPFALGYQVQYRPVGGNSQTASVFDAQFSPSGNVPPGNYEYRVRAFCPEIGFGNFSAWNAAGTGLQASLISLSQTPEGIGVFFSGKENTPVEIEVYSTDGRRVLILEEMLFPSIEKVIPIQDLSSGIYIIIAQTTGESLRKRIFIP